MKKEQLTMFDLEAAFKALDEIEVPKAAKGIRANKEDLKESFKDFNRSRTDLLIEDYYDISDTADLEEAKAEREAEVAKAKLARIEKIVDLEAESEEDLLPSYVGKMIIQCPQCMTLFYKNEEDIVKSETDEETVNVAEICQHCGNESGYTLIGKVEGIQEGELIPEENVEEIPAEEENIDLEPAEEVEETSDEDKEDLDLAPVEASEEPEEEDEVVEESLQLNEEVQSKLTESIDEADFDKIISIIKQDLIQAFDFDIIVEDGEFYEEDGFKDIYVEWKDFDCESEEFESVVNWIEANENKYENFKLNLLDEENVDFITINVYAKKALTEDFDGDKETLKTAINSAMKDPESDKAKIINTVIDHVEEKDIEKVFDLLDKHAGNVKLSKEQIDKIIEKLPENSKEKARAEKWSTVRNVLDFIDYTPELKENPDTFLWIVKIVFLIVAVACPADAFVLDIIAAVMMLIPNKLLGKLWAALATIISPTLWIAKGGKAIADKAIKKNVVKAGEEDTKEVVEESLKVKLNESVEDYIEFDEGMTDDDNSHARRADVEYNDDDGYDIRAWWYIPAGKNASDLCEYLSYDCGFMYIDINDILPYKGKDYPNFEFIDIIESDEEDFDESLKEDIIIYKKGVFTPGRGGEGFVGYYNPNYNWNGWLAPGFEKEECDKIMASYNDAMGEDLMSYDGELNAYVELDDYDKDEEPYIYEKTECETTEGKKQLYFIGDGWTWDLLQEDLKEAVNKDLQAKLDAHNDYIKYLQEEIEKEEKALEAAKNDFIKEAIQRRIEVLYEELDQALPEEIKNTVEAEEAAPAEFEASVEEINSEKISTETPEEEVEEKPEDAAKELQDKPEIDKESKQESLKENKLVEKSEEAEILTEKLAALQKQALIKFNTKWVKALKNGSASGKLPSIIGENVSYFSKRENEKRYANKFICTIDDVILDQNSGEINLVIKYLRGDVEYTRLRSFVSFFSVCKFVNKSDITMCYKLQAQSEYLQRRLETYEEDRQYERRNYARSGHAAADRDRANAEELAAAFLASADIENAKTWLINNVNKIEFGLVYNDLEKLRADVKSGKLKLRHISADTIDYLCNIDRYDVKSGSLAKKNDRTEDFLASCQPALKMGSDFHYKKIEDNQQANFDYYINFYRNSATITFASELDNAPEAIQILATEAYNLSNRKRRELEQANRGYNIEDYGEEQEPNTTPYDRVQSNMYLALALGIIFGQNNKYNFHFYRQRQANIGEALHEESKQPVKELSTSEFNDLMDYLAKDDDKNADSEKDNSNDKLKNVEEIDEKQLAESIYHNLKESIKDLKAIKVLNCKLDNNKLIIEGKMKVANKVENLIYTCEDIKITKNIFKATGLVESLNHTSKVNLTGNIKNNILNIKKINNK